MVFPPLPWYEPRYYVLDGRSNLRRLTLINRHLRTIARPDWRDYAFDTAHQREIDQMEAHVIVDSSFSATIDAPLARIDIPA